MKEIKEKIEKIIEIIDGVYETESSNLIKKKENLKKINVETLSKHLQSEFKNGNISNDKDLVRYIELIIQD